MTTDAYKSHLDSYVGLMKEIRRVAESLEAVDEGISNVDMWSIDLKTDTVQGIRNEKGELVGNVKSYTNYDALMGIFRNSGMDVKPNSCPNCTHEIESKDAIFCSHCGKRLRKE